MSVDVMTLAVPDIARNLQGFIMEDDVTAFTPDRSLRDLLAEGPVGYAGEGVRLMHYLHSTYGLPRNLIDQRRTEVERGTLTLGGAAQLIYDHLHAAEVAA